MIPLTNKQERFVVEYLIDQNASAAARRAGYSPRSASSVASELMNTPHVRERMRAAFFRARRLFKGNQLRAFDELDDETYDALFISYEMRESGPIIRVRQPNREQALRALERVHERLDRLQDARCLRAGGAAAGNETEAVEVASSVTPPAGIVLDLQLIDTEPVPAPVEPVMSKNKATTGAPPVSDMPAATSALDEKTQVFAGSTPSAPVSDPDKPKLSPFGEVVAAWRARKSRETPGMKPAWPRVAGG